MVRLGNMPEIAIPVIFLTGQDLPAILVDIEYPAGVSSLPNRSASDSLTFVYPLSENPSIATVKPATKWLRIPFHLH